MRIVPVTVAIVAAVLLSSSCAKRIPESTGITPGTPHVSWVIMSGDRENPDQDFVCQSEPRGDCVVPASRPDAQVFSDVHVYYHRAGGDTKYTGSMRIGFFRGSADSNTNQIDITVQKTQSIANQSVTGIVTETPGMYALGFALAGTSTATANAEPIREQIQVVVK